MKNIWFGLIALILISNNALGGNFYNGFYSNSLDGSDWHCYTASKGTTEIGKDVGPHFVTFKGNGTRTGFYKILTPVVKNGTNIQFLLKFTNYFKVYIQVMTTNGIRYMTYYPIEENLGKQGRFIQLGLGVRARRGYRVVKRNLQEDLEKFEESNSILEVRAFFIRGSGTIDGGIFVYPESNNEITLEPASNSDKEKLLELSKNPPKDRFKYGVNIRTDYIDYLIVAFTSSSNEPISSFYTLSKDKKSLVKMFDLPKAGRIENDQYGISIENKIITVHRFNYPNNNYIDRYDISDKYNPYHISHYHFEE